ncbi:MAG: FAD-binding protein [Candidatus Altiarchaeales archaeon]|nr:FAD-binding protein [Candidatus Altiarchaeales archaeon]MBD3415757.1 FAD-binding protein [Candidatus Altiarchaeales archaeon]
MGEYDFIVVGGGPAGMFAAYALSEAGRKVLLLDEGKNVSDRHCPMAESGACVNCRPCDVMTGLGGSGLYSDGTLNLRPDIGGDLSQLTGSDDRAWELVERVDEIFLRHGAPDRLYGGDEEKIAELKRRCASDDIKFIDIRQRHIGTENTPAVIESIAEHLRGSGVDIMVSTRVEDIIVEDGRCVGVKTVKEEFRAGGVLLAPGRVGAKWVDELVAEHGIKAVFGPIDVGVRVEVPALIMESVIEVNHDPKFHIRTPTYDDFVRTFCTNHQGWVVKESYDGLVGVNGHSMLKDMSGNTNFAFLVRVALTEPVEDTVEYGRAIADLATTIGGGKPILQRLGDLRHGRRSHPHNIADNLFENTLKDVTPGDVSMALPHRIVEDILEGLEKLNDVIPGVNSDSTLVYAPELKFYSMCVEVGSRMDSSIPGLHVAGDGVGLSRDIVNAAATGLLAAEGMLPR